jgi:hypothetical protein
MDGGGVERLGIFGVSLAFSPVCSSRLVCGVVVGVVKLDVIFIYFL